MIFLKDYKEAIGKTIADVKEYVDDSFDDSIQYTLIIFHDNTCILYMDEQGYRNSYGIIDSTSSFFTANAKTALGL